MKIEKQDLINMICGVEKPDIDESIELEKLGLMYFSGNQWNEDWSWDRSNLSKLTEKELEVIYEKYRGN
ncbi:MAG: hypothetical protein WC554_17485 [Clostridia bacterium]